MECDRSQQDGDKMVEEAKSKFVFMKEDQKNKAQHTKPLFTGINTIDFDSEDSFE